MSRRYSGITLGPARFANVPPPRGKDSKRSRVPEKVRSQAERIIETTADEARLLPGMLKCIVPAMLLHRPGHWYGATVDGVRTLYVWRQP